MEAKRFAVVLIVLLAAAAAYPYNIQVGPRPYYILNELEDGELKHYLEMCRELPLRASVFSIGHRGACLQFPEHTVESYVAAARMGAGVMECDVTFTSDLELVCRHAQCDLHTTTNILMTDLADKCSEPFKPARDGKPASAKCCASDITLEEFKTLCGKMDAANTEAKTVEEYVMGTANWRTDLYSTCGTLMTHKESIGLFLHLGVEMTPELKSPEVDMPYKGLYTQDMYREQLIHEYMEMRVPATSVWPQSFNLDDVLYWVNNSGLYGQQAVFLDSRYDMDTSDPDAFEPSMKDIAKMGINVIAPPQQMLLTVDAFNNIIPSEYGPAAKKAGLKIISWSFERSGPLPASRDTFYYGSISAAMNNDGDMFKLIHVLAQEVGVIGMFTDWPGTVTYYASCFGL